ncbi:MAG: Gfo/Idh/MocA family oxidoreductase [Caulobacteraceae bacterium]|nr:Gfo/Idh/MocA family oxidoreductase [Caulobacter sp.]
MPEPETAAIPIGVVGIGKIALDQHLPVIAEGRDFHLAGAASRHAEAPGAPTYQTVEALLDAQPDMAAVALCTPPQVRAAQARAALEAGRHVLLEKPPGMTLAEVDALAALAERRGVTLFAAWHSRFAPAVEPARTRLAGRQVRSARIRWREDVRRWHPGQDWVWEAGGLGVFDPGINALSIATRILPQPFALREGELSVPAGRQTPIAADLRFALEGGGELRAEFDWRETGEPRWEIAVETEAGPLTLSQGGARLRDGDAEVALEGADDPHAEYRGVYRRFAALIRAGERDVDAAPLRHAADAFLAARRTEVETFEW